MIDPRNHEGIFNTACTLNAPRPVIMDNSDLELMVKFVAKLAMKIDVELSNTEEMISEMEEILNV